MSTSDIIIVVFMLFIALGLIYNRLVKIKKAKEKGISAGCATCMYSSQCSKAQDACQNKHIKTCCSSVDLSKYQG